MICQRRAYNKEMWFFAKWKKVKVLEMEDQYITIEQYITLPENLRNINEIICNKMWTQDLFYIEFPPSWNRCWIWTIGHYYIWPLVYSTLVIYGEVITIIFFKHLWEPLVEWPLEGHTNWLNKLQCTNHQIYAT